MKICTNCKEEKPESEFYARQGRCKKCHGEIDRNYSKKIYYPKNKEKIIKYNKEDKHIQAISIDEKRRYVVEYLLNHPCETCGEADPIVLVFDHIDPDSKTRNVSRFICQGTMEELIAEMEKCRVLCANCHARRTAKQQKWKILDILSEK
jgi:hypothetical protein